MTDAELVRLARDGHASAYEQLVRRWSPRVLAVCRARVGQPSAAEDLAQEALLRSVQHLSALADPARFGAWLRGIAVHVCCDWLKARGGTDAAVTQDGFDPADHAESPSQQVEHEDNRRRLLAEVQALPEDLREVILLHYFDRVTYAELSDVLGVSRATVNTRLAKAREQLARRLAFLMR